MNLQYLIDLIEEGDEDECLFYIDWMRRDGTLHLIINQGDESGATLLHHAVMAETASLKIVEMLIENNANINAKVISATAPRPIHLALQFAFTHDTDEEIYYHLCATVGPLMKKAKADGININLPDDEGKYPYDMVCEMEKYHAKKISKKHDIFEKNIESDSADLTDEAIYYIKRRVGRERSAVTRATPIQKILGELRDYLKYTSYHFGDEEEVVDTRNQGRRGLRTVPSMTYDEERNVWKKTQRPKLEVQDFKRRPAEELLPPPPNFTLPGQVPEDYKLRASPIEPLKRTQAAFFESSPEIARIPVNFFDDPIAPPKTGAVKQAKALMGQEQEIPGYSYPRK